MHAGALQRRARSPAPPTRARVRASGEHGFGRPDATSPSLFHELEGGSVAEAACATLESRLDTFTVGSGQELGFLPSGQTKYLDLGCMGGGRGVVPSWLA
jgi:hypothetical protein